VGLTGGSTCQVLRGTFRWIFYKEAVACAICVAAAPAAAGGPFFFLRKKGFDFYC